MYGVISSEIESEVGVSKINILIAALLAFESLLNLLFLGDSGVLVSGLAIWVGLLMGSLLVFASSKRDIKCSFAVRLDNVGCWIGELFILNL